MQIAVYENALERGPNAAILNCLGIAYYEAALYRDAIEAYDSAILMAGPYADLLIHKGNSFDQLGEIEVALELYQQAERLDPQNPSAPYNLGVALLGQSKPKEALKAFERAVELAPGDTNALVNLGATYLVLEQPKKAIPHFQEALRLQPGMPNAIRGLIHAFTKTGRESDAAVYFGLLEASEDKLEEAMQAWSAALADGHPLAAFYLGSVIFAEGNAADSLPLLESAVRSAPEMTEFRLRFAVALQSAGLPERSAAELRKLLRNEPKLAKDRLDLARALSNTGSALSLSQSFKEALFLLNAAIKLSPEYDIAHYNLAQAYHRSGDDVNAELHFREAARVNPQHAHAMSNLASVLSETNRKQEALDLAFRALRAEPRDAVALTVFAELYTEFGWWQQAENMWRKCIEAVAEGFGPEHPVLAARLREFASFLRQIGREKEGTELEARAELIEETSPPDMKPKGNFEIRSVQ